MTRAELEKLAMKYRQDADARGYVADQEEFESAFIAGFKAGKDAAAECLSQRLLPRYKLN
jgi:hypothetical protein